MFLSNQGAAINKAGCDLAKDVASEGDALVLGGICQTPSYLSGLGKDAVQNEFRKQISVFVENGVDFLLCEVGVLLIEVNTVFYLSSKVNTVFCLSS